MAERPKSVDKGFFRTAGALGPRFRRPAFTLLAGGVSLVLVVAALVVHDAVRSRRAAIASSRSASSLASALRAFADEYGRFPVISPYGDAIVPSDDSLVAPLVGRDPSDNPRAIVFLDRRSPESPPSGPAAQPVAATHGGIVDAWGSPFVVILDTDFDRTLRNPEPEARPAVLHDTVLVFSAGPDRDEATWADNLRSWQ